MQRVRGEGARSYMYGEGIWEIDLLRAGVIIDRGGECFTGC